MRRLIEDLILYSRFLDVLTAVLFAPFDLCYWVWRKLRRAVCNAPTIKSKHKLLEYVDLIHKTGSPHSPECQQFCLDNVGDTDFYRRAKTLDALILKLNPEIE